MRQMSALSETISPLQRTGRPPAAVVPSPLRRHQ